jgi:hypothetical protein
VVAWQVATFCCDMGIHCAIFEGDSLTVVSTLRRERPCWSGSGQLIEDTKIRLNSLHFNDIRHIRKDANTAAYCMVKLTLL